MEYSNHITFENVVEADPTLKFFLRDAEMDYDKLEHQAMVMGSVIVIAINKWLDLKYMTRDEALQPMIDLNYR